MMEEGGWFIAAPKVSAGARWRRRRHLRKYVSVYSIIPAVSYCGPDMFRMRVSRWFEGFFQAESLEELTKPMCLPFLPPRRESARALNTCVSEIRLIKFDEFKKRGEIIMS